MPIPLIVGGLALASAAAGVKKGYDAKQKMDKAKRIVEKVKSDFDETEIKLEEEGNILKDKLESFADFRKTTFKKQVNKLIEVLKKYKKSASSTLSNEKISFTPEEIKQLEDAVAESLEISSGLATGATSGALTAIGAYSGVGLLASASTGTAISTLSGAAATNATLAWLGGGSLAAGGGGMALGTAVLGGVVAGPLIAVTGFVVDSKAEENLTNAYKYERDMELKIEAMQASRNELDIITKRLDELSDVINKIVNRFDTQYHNLMRLKNKREKIQNFLGFDPRRRRQKEIEQLLVIGKNLKSALEILLIDSEGNHNENFTVQIERIPA